jgi:hypothetical protein
MSRSYGKCDDCGYAISRHWHRSLRTNERECIHKEMRSEDYGEVIFPVISEISAPRDDDVSRSICSKKSIREEYFNDISNIINGYVYRYSYMTHGQDSIHETFLKYFNEIKNSNLRDTGWKFSLKWLRLKEIKKVIKAWKGDPIDVLYYLAHSGLIEKAVNVEYKRQTKK